MTTKTSTDHLPIHLDIHVDDCTSVVDSGANTVETKSLEVGPHRQVWTVMKDPEGNFCVASPEGTGD